MKFDPVLFAKAIADDTRQKIMSACCCCELSVNEIVEKIGFSQPTISHHLAILRDAGLVSTREEGKQTFYTLMLKFAPESETTLAVKQAIES